MGKKKFTPCSLYDTEKLVCWLDMMAAQGLMLEHEGYKNTYAKFVESEKKKTFHRIWPKDSLNEYKDAKELRESYGWELVSSSFDYDIYRSFDDSSLRIDNEEKNDFYCKKASNKRLLKQILQILFSVAVLILILFISPFMIVSEYDGLFMVIEFLIIFVMEILKGICNIRMILKIKTGNKNKPIDDNINWKKETIMHQTPNIISTIVLILFGFILIWNKFDVPVSSPLPEDNLNLPFATVIDFTDDKASCFPKKSILNKYKNWETPVAKDNYEWNEYAKIKTEEEYQITCGISVDYHETAHPIIAKAVAKLYIAEAKTTPYAFGNFGECPSFGFDFEAMYYSEAGDKIYVFQDGNKIIHFTIGCYGELPEGFDAEKFNRKCLEIMAESFRE